MFVRMELNFNPILEPCCDTGRGTQLNAGFIENILAELNEGGFLIGEFRVIKTIFRETLSSNRFPEFLETLFVPF